MTSFRDGQDQCYRDYSPGRTEYILAAAGHIILLVLGTITFSHDGGMITGGEDAIMVRMVTPASSVQDVQEDVQVQEETQDQVQEVVQIPEETQDQVQEDIQEDVQVPEETQDQVQEEVQEDVQVPEETQDEVQQENSDESYQEETSDFATVSSQGSAGGGVPGPGTYESRVFNAVRRGYRTSVTPQQSYRVVLTVFPDGTTSVDVVRSSGTSAFDRAVENALATAQIPPMPPGRTSPAVINIEFLGPE